MLSTTEGIAFTTNTQKGDDFMNSFDVKAIVAEVLKEAYAHKPPIKHIKQKMEFSKKLMIFLSLIFATTWGLAVYSWFAGGEFPWALVEFVNWLYGASFVSYCGKSAYENKCKIEQGGEV